MNGDEPVGEDNGNENVGTILSYYGSVRGIGERIYITYSNSPEDIIEKPFFTQTAPLQQANQSVYASAALELSENEEPFLIFLQNTEEEVYTEKNISIAYSGDIKLYPFSYAQRLETIQAIFKQQYHLVLVSKNMEKANDVHEQVYLPILKKYWGYSKFRELKIYKNIQEAAYNKETIEVSQSQIINDVVKQVLYSKKGETYKDIFVTSPTGAGKSVMFQIPAIHIAEAYNLMTIVISPLIGLMADQVQGLERRNVEISATINSDITPIEKLEIMEKIRTGKISILYISPETLLSRSDISQLIGEREVGLFVIDEAHIVTTWGKAFRSDYWYLGSYLSKLRKEKNFPIATFTATAIYGGIEDMYGETRDSLGLINPISYFGYVKRDNLSVRIKKKENYEKKYNEYLSDKNKILLLRLEKFVKEKRKTLVYFPTIRFITDFREYCRVYGSVELQENLSYYYGPLEKEYKQANYLRYKNNEAIVMLATKAFGMGIDIPDIENVYHFAPTGNVCDYIQEIGRAARDLPEGYAYFDFLPKDFVHVKRLHGISTLRKNQLLQVMRKILAVMEEHRGKNIRNILVSADEFRYIFQAGNDRDDDIDNKVKTALLIIEKDFNAKMTYSPIVARPRSIFAKEFFMVNQEVERLIRGKHSKYFTLIQKYDGSGSVYGNIYACDMKNLWSDHHTSLSYPQFKYKFYARELDKEYPFAKQLIPVMKLDLHLKSQDIESFKMQLKQWLHNIDSIFGLYARDKSYFSVQDIAEKLKAIRGGSKYSNENLAELILESAFSYDRITKKSKNFYSRFIAYDENREKYHLLNTGYAGFTEWINQETNNLLRHANTLMKDDQHYEIFLPKVFGANQEKLFIHLGVLESLGLLMYRVNGGENPEIFIRVNSKTQLDRVVNSPSKYNNLILENVHLRHQISVAMLTYLFETEADTERFWTLIEEYFLGKIPQDILNRVASK